MALKDGGGIRYKIMPYVEQKALYERVNQKLSDGECITIFPEGGSHDRTELLPLKGELRAYQGNDRTCTELLL